MSKTAVAMFAEHTFKDLLWFESEELANVFALGFEKGAGCYGAGSACGYVLPLQVVELREGEPDREVSLALGKFVRERPK